VRQLIFQKYLSKRPLHGLTSTFPITVRSRNWANACVVSAKLYMLSMTAFNFPCSAQSNVFCKSARLRP